MEHTQQLEKLAEEQLYLTSRTFFIPIQNLPKGLWEIVTSAYLSLRAIDEIEDHPILPKQDKLLLLRSLVQLMENKYRLPSKRMLDELFSSYVTLLPEVTLRIYDWLCLCPKRYTTLIIEATRAMGDGMAYWVEKNWNIETKQDLDQYTYYVAGLVGIMLSEIWEKYEGLKTDPNLAISFGRGLQAVNMVRNRTEDLQRGVDYYPHGWSTDDMIAYARHHLFRGALYMKYIPKGPIHSFCKIPLELAWATLQKIETGANKLARDEVMKIVNPILHD